MKITIEVVNPRPDSIYSKLEKKLGRKPTTQEIQDEVRRILATARP